MPRKIDTVLRYLLALLGFNERRCAFCLTPFIPEGEETFCSPCLESMIDTVPRCTLCGEKLGVAGGICGTCITRKRPWAEFISLGAYAGILREAVLVGKFNANLPVLEGLGRALGLKWQQHAGISIQSEKAWTLLPVPLHPRKLALRGFNQCAEIGRGMTRVTGIHLDITSLTRVRNTTTQRNLSRTERWKNIESAFACSDNVRGQCCIILDDVMTTGATIEAAADAVLKAGARKVYALAVARDDRHEYR